MFIMLYALAVSLLIVGILWAEILSRGFAADNVFTRTREAIEYRQWTRRVAALDEARRIEAIAAAAAE